MNLMAIVMALGMVFVAGPVMAGNGDVGGTIGDVRNIDSATIVGTTYFSGIDVADYDTGHQESATDASSITVTANTAWEVTVTAGVTGDYFDLSPVGLGVTPRTLNQKPLADLFIKVNNIDKGSDANAVLPAVENTFDTYKAVTFLAQDLINSASGNDSANWNIQYKMMLDASSDTPGAYSCAMTYTIQADD
jgi:hypothetical protein